MEDQDGVMEACKVRGDGYTGTEVLPLGPTHLTMFLHDVRYPTGDCFTCSIVWIISLIPDRRVRSFQDNFCGKYMLIWQHNCAPEREKRWETSSYTKKMYVGGNGILTPQGGGFSEESKGLIITDKADTLCPDLSKGAIGVFDHMIQWMNEWMHQSHMGYVTW